MNNLNRCKQCGSIPEIHTLEVAEDDEGKYIVEMYNVTCSNPECNSQTYPHWYEDDAVEEWNNKFGKKSLTLEELIYLRGVDKPDYDGAGLPPDNSWTYYYKGWKDAYKDLREILEQHGFDLSQNVIKSD